MVPVMLAVMAMMAARTSVIAVKKAKEREAPEEMG
jgi:hypothetical protein